MTERFVYDMGWYHLGNSFPIWSVWQNPKFDYISYVDTIGISLYTCSSCSMCARVYLYDAIYDVPSNVLKSMHFSQIRGCLTVYFSRAISLFLFAFCIPYGFLCVAFVFVSFWVVAFCTDKLLIIILLPLKKSLKLSRDSWVYL